MCTEILPKPGAWSKVLPFSPLRFGQRLKRAKIVAATYRIRAKGLLPKKALYEVRGKSPAYTVVVDLSGRASHHCSCPDGAWRIAAIGRGGSLCKHVLACMLSQGYGHLIVPFICLKAGGES